MKPLSLPTPVGRPGGTGGRAPGRCAWEGGGGEVGCILETWCFDLWWMPRPLTRTYYRVIREEGGELTLFRDGQTGGWFRQDPEGCINACLSG